ncbi:MAG: pyridoxamine 5'-phosphate oxidase family protein [Candidatus Thorarchaeota archaeon]
MFYERDEMFLVKPQKGLTKHVKEIPLEALKILENCYFAYLGTTRIGCDPHITAMFYIWDDKTKSIYLVSTQKSAKVRNIRRNPKVTITVDERDPNSPAQNSGVMIRGKAQLIPMEDADDVLMSQYLIKYYNFLSEGYPLGSRIAIRVKVRNLSYWRGTNFAKWKNPD